MCLLLPRLCSSSILPWPPRPCSTPSTREVWLRSAPSWQEIRPWPIIGMGSGRYVLGEGGVVGRKTGKAGRRRGCTQLFSMFTQTSISSPPSSRPSTTLNPRYHHPHPSSPSLPFPLPFLLQTPLMWAAYKGRVDMVSCLLDCGARINECETRRARTALYLACEFDHAPVVALLLTRGANPTLAAQRGEGGGEGGREGGRGGRQGNKEKRFGREERETG